ncbi:hypothetical protein PQ465_02165 [Sphingobacterium oryzagri]|uniref:Uncharacterized protein n=1 Tax=Sphingobacterium oryzagri TaxID=3025669 RepID=A0ABY7WHV8_9SPHI|nr:hypothetical protein [Sphingobacterium sp. KACC 22765]WDF69198.1 hypothetical protein PQ465_02165 [Sphingobacterium sp. KACC 22765]
MKEKVYTVDEIKLLETQLAIKKVLKKNNLIYVSDDDFAVVQEILRKNDVAYSSIRNPELRINTLLIV